MQEEGTDISRRKPPGSGRCLVLALDGIGDMVLRQPLLAGLADAGYEVHVLVQEGHEPLLPFLDERLLGIPAPLKWTCPPAIQTVRGLLDRLGRLEPTLVVSAQFNPVRYVDWIRRQLGGVFGAGFVGGAWQEVAGARRLEPELSLPEGRPLDLQVRCDEPLHEADKARRLLAALLGGSPPARSPRLMLRQADRERGESFLRSVRLRSQAYAVCCPAGTKNVTIKAWPADRFGRIAGWLTREKGLPTLVIGHRSEEEAVGACVRSARSAGGDPRAWLGDIEEIETMVAVLGLARLYLGNDTGPMHVAAAAGVPVVAVFGGGHWPRFLPVAALGAVHTRRLPCFGCGWRHCFFGEGICVTRVEERAVRGSVERVLAGIAGFEVNDEEMTVGERELKQAAWTFRELSRRLDESINETE
jgi:ADP-heptose:LPS heptosyltransferase